MNKEVENVKCPEPEPEETKRIFQGLSKRKQWSPYGGDKNDNIIPPTNPLPPTESEDGDDDDDPHPLPVAEISNEFYEELVVPEDPEDTHCWRCGTGDGTRKLSNGAVLCVPCEEILKP